MTEHDCARLRRVRPAAMRPGEPGRGAAFAAGRGAELLSAARRRPIEDVLQAQSERGKAKGPRRRRRLLGVSRCAAQNFWPSGILRGKTLRRPCFAKMPLFFSLRLSFFVSCLAVAPPSAVVASLGRGFSLSRFAPSLVVSPGFCLFLFPFRLDLVFVSCAAPGAKGRLPGAVGGPGKGARFDSLALSQEKADPEKKTTGNYTSQQFAASAGRMPWAWVDATSQARGAGRIGARSARKRDGAKVGWLGRRRPGARRPSIRLGATKRRGGRAAGSRRAIAEKKKGAEGEGRRGAGRESASNAPAGLLLRPASFFPFFFSPPLFPAAASCLLAAARRRRGGQPEARYCSVAESSTKRYFTSPLIMRS